MRDIKKWKKETLTNEPPKGSSLKVGDVVQWVNCYGVQWTNKIIGFNYDNWYNKKYSAFVHLNTDSFWFPHKANELTIINTKQLNK